MARYTIRLLRLAEEDVAEILAYIAAERPSAAEALAAKIEKNLGHLARDPSIGRLPNDADLLGLGYRYLIVEDYLVFYTIEERNIIVHRIVHGARNYSNLL
jgi:plasmid stabilization system protein ParE